MALTDLTRISTSGIATGTSLSGAILHGDAHFRGTQVGVTSALFDSSDDALEFNDNVKLKFGNSGDLELYHDPTGNSYIKETGGGSLVINADDFYLQNVATTTFLRTQAAGSVEINFNGNKKFETTNHGAVVTGILTATGFSGPTNNTSGIATFYDLRVSNNLTVEGTTTTLDTNLIGVDRVEVGANSNTVVGVAVTQSGTADILRLYDGTSQEVTVDGTGKVGIGSAIPAEKLDVNGTSNFTGQVRVSDGTTSVPSVAAASDTNSGLYFPGADAVGLVAGGSRKLLANSSGITINNGDLAVNGGNLDVTGDIRHIDNTNTKISFTTNTISFDTAAAERLRINSSGNVGIGTDNPESGQLQVVGGGYSQINISGNKNTNVNKTGGISFLNYEGNKTSVFQTFANSSSNTIYYGSADSSARGVTAHKFYVNTDQNATTSHALALNIDSVGKITTNTTGTIIADYNSSNSGGAYVQYDIGANGANIGYIGAAAHLSSGGSNTDLGIRAANNLDIAVGGSSRKVFIYNSGNIQLNTTGTLAVDFNTSNSGGAYFNFDLGASGANIGYLGAASHLVGGAATADLAIRSTSNFVISTGGAVERLRIASGGNISIGGNFTAGRKVHIKDSGIIKLENTTTGGWAGLEFMVSSGTNNYDAYMGMQDSNGLFFIDNNSNGIDLCINQGGKVFIGADSTDFSDAGTFLNLKQDTYGGRIGFSNATASAGVTLMEQFAYWGTNKVAGIAILAGNDTTNKDDARMSFYTRKSGESVKERVRISDIGSLVAGYRVGTSQVYSNQPVAFHSARVTPDTASSTVSDAVRCNLYVGSNSGWAAGDGGMIGMGGSRSGTAAEEAIWAYIKGSRQSGNGWEYAGKMELGTTEWNTYNTTKAVTIYADNQIEQHGDDNTMYSGRINGAVRVRLQHSSNNMTLSNPSGGNFTFDTSSDYRLKENVVGISSALTTVKALKPYQYTWKHDNKLGQGFLAHEAQEVLPDVGIVSGTKDAVQTEDDTKHDGQWKKGDPIYQQIDYSKLVPLLTAALQEETAKREALEARVSALEG